MKSKNLERFRNPAPLKQKTASPLMGHKLGENASVRVIDDNVEGGKHCLELMQDVFGDGDISFLVLQADQARALAKWLADNVQHF
jgi:hypothetical protein